ncbi:MAG: LysM peptidoglycan-binding domain-containing protein [Verrucomicrobiales bacterium]|nr:LysM peptidoglycan-binding domain-containing protein [Verrucomicrobiales bacterium]
MKYLYLLLSLGLAVSVTSCKTNKKTAATNAYQNNPYYGPSGSSYGSSTTDYSSTATSTSYPSYSESTYTPPTQTTPAPSVPSVPSYSAPAPSYSAPAPSYSGPAASGGSHTVARGENLYRISLKHGTSVAAIKSANGLAGDTIHPGQVLRIP